MDQNEIDVIVNLITDQFTSAAKTIGIAVQQMGTDVADSAQKQQTSLDKISTIGASWQFRYLANIAREAFDQMVSDIENVIGVAANLQQTFLNVDEAAIMFGNNADDATAYANKLAMTGLVPLQDAAESTRNLLMSGIGMPELQEFTQRYLDLASLFPDSADQMASSLDNITAAIVKGTNQSRGDIAAKTLWNDALLKLHETSKLTITDLTAEQRANLLLSTLNTDLAKTQGLSTIEMSTANDTLNRLNTSFTQIKDTIGTALLPFLDIIASVFAGISNIVSYLTDLFGPLVPAVVAAVIAFTGLSAIVFSCIALFIALSAAAAVLDVSLGAILLPIAAVAIGLGVGVGLWTAFSGALDKTKNSAAGVASQLKALQGTVSGAEGSPDDTGASNAASAAYQDKALQHKQATENIQADIDKETSKGLWANQITIADDKRKLDQENENWNLYLSQQQAGTTASTYSTGDMFSDILNKANATSTALGGINFWKGLTDQTTKVMNWLDSINWSALGSQAGTLIGNAIVTAVQFAWNLAGQLFKALNRVDWSKVGEQIGTWLGGFIVATTVAVFNLAAVLFKALKKADWVQIGETLGDWVWEGFLNAINILGGFEKGLGTQIGNALAGLLKTATQNSGEQTMFNNLMNAEAKGWSNIAHLLGFADGGIVPGAIGQPMLAVVHGGETVIPVGHAGGDTITVNINNPSVQNSNDITKIANAVKQVLSQRQKWAQMGGV